MSRQAREPGRTCLGCRGQRPRAELIRIVRDPDGAGCFDLEGRLPGRGAWICPEPACLDAVAPGALSHVLKAPVRLSAPAERRRELAEAFGRRLANLLTMARRMRGVKMGRTGARAALAEGRARLLLVAGDAAPDALSSWTGRAGAVPVSSGPDAAALGGLFGRGPVDVVAITAEGLAAAILQANDRRRVFSAVSCDNEGKKLMGHRARRGAVPRREEAEEQ